MPSITLPEVNTAIAEIIQTAAPGLLVLQHEIQGLDSDEGLNVDILRPTPESPAHALLFWLSADLRQRIGDVDYVAELARRTRRFDLTWTFSLRHVYEYSTGQNSSNNYLTAFAERKAITDALSRKPKLGIDNPNLRQHNDLQWVRLQSRFHNDRLIHVAQGRLDVIIYESIAPQ